MCCDTRRVFGHLTVTLDTASEFSTQQKNVVVGVSGKLVSLAYWYTIGITAIPDNCLLASVLFSLAST